MWKIIISLKNKLVNYVRKMVVVKLLLNAFRQSRWILMIISSRISVKMWLKGIDRLTCLSEMCGRRVEEIGDKIQSVVLGYEIDIVKY